MDILWKLSDLSGVKLEVLAESAELYALVNKNTPEKELVTWIKANLSKKK